MLELHADFGIVYAMIVSDIGLDADVVQAALLGDGLCLVREGVGARKVLDRIEPVEWVDRQQR